MERQIRDAKRECMMLDETGDKDEFAKASLRLKNKRAQYREYCNETGLRQHNDRTQVYGFDRSVSSKTTWAAKKSQTGGSSSGAVGSVATSVSTSQVDSDLNTVSYVTPETIKETLKGLTSPSGSSIISSKPSIILESRDYKEASVALYDSMQKQHSTITSSPIRKSIAKHQKPDGSNGGYVATRNYSNINQKLRDNEFDLLDADDKQTVESMRTAISKNTLGSDLVLTRYVNADYLKPVFGIDVDYMDMELRPDAKDSNKKRQNIVQSLKDKVDTEFTEKAFVSTSIIKDNNIMTDKSVRLTINAPKETHCYIPKNKRESECILGENSRFYITDIKESDDGKIEIFVTIIN